MTCPSCGSIWLRPTTSKWNPSTTQPNVWMKRAHCGGCGGMFTIEAQRIGTDKTDMERHRALREPTIAVVTSTGNAGGNAGGHS